MSHNHRGSSFQAHTQHCTEMVITWCDADQLSTAWACWVHCMQVGGVHDQSQPQRVCQEFTSYSYAFP